MQIRSHALEVATKDVACVSTGTPKLPPGASHRRIEEYLRRLNRAPPLWANLFAGSGNQYSVPVPVSSPCDSLGHPHNQNSPSRCAWICIQIRRDRHNYERLQMNARLLQTTRMRLGTSGEQKVDISRKGRESTARMSLVHLYNDRF